MILYVVLSEGRNLFANRAGQWGPAHFGAGETIVMDLRQLPAGQRQIQRPKLLTGFFEFANLIRTMPPGDSADQAV